MDLAGVVDGHKARVFEAHGGKRDTENFTLEAI
jgi:hypothetical protein